LVLIIYFCRLRRAIFELIEQVDPHRLLLYPQLYQLLFFVKKDPESTNPDGAPVSSKPRGTDTGQIR
jgi:hypothetical protein